LSIDTTNPIATPASAARKSATTMFGLSMTPAAKRASVPAALTFGNFCV
jgi:hypothetical protein